MKRIILAIAVILMASCAKEPQEIKVVFTLGVESSSLTKATSSEIAAFIMEQTKDNIKSVTLTNQTTEQEYKVTPNVEITLPVGSYVAAATYTPQSYATIANGGNLSTTPQLAIFQEFEVAYPTTEYPLNVRYDSFAIVTDYSECDNVQYMVGGYMQDFTWVESGDLRLTFASGSFNKAPLCVYLTPDEAGYETWYYQFYLDSSKSGEANAIIAENGKWYFLHPKKKTALKGSFGFNYPDWTDGSEESE